MTTSDELKQIGARLIQIGNELVAPAPAPAPVSTMPGINAFSGWRRIFAQDFLTPCAEGQFVTTYDTTIWPYPDGWPDTNGKAPAQGGMGAPSRYMPSKVLSARDSCMVKRLRVENGTPMVAAVAPKLLANRMAGIYSAKVKVLNPGPGWKTAWLLWPDVEGVWPANGEIDFPEGDLTGAMSGFMHRQGATSNTDQDAVGTQAKFTDWHTVTIVWRAGVSCDFLLDGNAICHWTNRVPKTSMHWVLQTETQLGTQPPATSSAEVMVDWVVAYEPI